MPFGKEFLGLTEGESVTAIKWYERQGLWWLAWLAGFSFCLGLLFYHDATHDPGQTGPAETVQQKTAAAGSGGKQGKFTGPDRKEVPPTAQHPSPYALLSPQGIMTGPDINALAPAINNRGRVVVEDPEPGQGATAFQAPPASPPPLTPDPEALKTKIAAKQKEVLDDTAFQAALSRYQAALTDKNFAGRANQVPEHGLGALIKKYSRQHGVDARLVWAVMRHESGFNPQAVSPKGAMGLMQLIPSTAALMGVVDPFDPEENISGGVRYLKLCLAKFNNNVILALAAYNAGPDNVTKYQGCPPFAETRNYVLKVMRDYTGQTVIIPLPVLAAGKAKGLQANVPIVEVASATPAPESGLDWKLPAAKFKVAGPTWKIPLKTTIIASRVPEAVRHNPEVTRLLAKQGLRKLAP